MTTVHQIGKIKISVYAAEHNPPHFHIASPESAATVNIATFEVISGDWPHAHVKKAIDWAKEHSHEIISEWKKLNE